MSTDEKWADLHIHTNKSDGTHTTEDVFMHAKNAGLSALSITDHDTVAAANEAVQLAQSYGIEFVPGVELSAMHESKEIHVVGLFMDWKNKKFEDTLVYFRKKRTERAEKIIRKLKENGVDVAFEELYEVTENMNNAGRLHIARLLLKKKYVRNIKEAFEKFLAEDKPAYVEKARISVSDAISIIKEVGGVSVLAHPALIKNDSLIPGWAAEGLDGIEVYHPDHGYEEQLRYTGLANELGLLISGGSDSHGSFKEYTSIGKIRISYDDFTKLKTKADGAKK